MLYIEVRVVSVTYYGGLKLKLSAQEMFGVLLACSKLIAVVKHLLATWIWQVFRPNRVVFVHWRYPQSAQLSRITLLV